MGIRSDFLNYCLHESEQGNEKSQNNLGLRYANGQGVSQSQHNLGVEYVNGTGILYDYKVSVRWYRKSSEQGGFAQNNLGVMYFLGQSVIQNYVMAYMY
jgi:uncharacterized protein